MPIYLAPVRIAWKNPIGDFKTIDCRRQILQ